MNRNITEPFIVLVIPFCLKLTCLIDAPAIRPNSIRINDIIMRSMLNGNPASNIVTNSIAITFSSPQTLREVTKSYIENNVNNTMKLLIKIGELNAVVNPMFVIANNLIDGNVKMNRITVIITVFIRILGSALLSMILTDCTFVWLMCF